MSFPLGGSGCLFRISAKKDQPYLLVEGVRLSGWKVSQESVEVTDSGDGAWRRLLSRAGLKSLEVRLEGLYLGSEGEQLLRQMAFEGAAFEGEFTLEAMSDLRGQFIATEFSFDSAVNEEATYAATLRSAGPITLD